MITILLPITQEEAPVLPQINRIRIVTMEMQTQNPDKQAVLAIIVVIIVMIIIVMETA